MQESAQTVPDELEDSEWLTNARDIETGMYIVHLTENVESGKASHQVMGVGDGFAKIILEGGIRATVELQDIHRSDEWVAIAE